MYWWRCNIGVVCLAVLILAGCDEPEQELIDTPTQVSVMTLVATKVDLTDELPGRVAAVRTAEIRAQVSGIVQHRLFEQGAEIKAGQPLFQINPAPFKADVDIASAALQRTEAAYVRAKVYVRRLHPLVATNAVSHQVYDDAVAQRDQTAAEVAAARATLVRRRLDLTFATVDAPISGRIDQALVTEGALVGTSDTNPMARIQQIDQVYVDVRQPASTLESLRGVFAAANPADSHGLPVAILRNNGDAYPVNGRILFSGINVDASTGDVLLRILVDNPQRLLLPGMFVRARVPHGSYAEALLVPQQAVVRNGEGAYIWVVDENRRAHLVLVRLGELVRRQYLILTGLHAGQNIVVEGMDRLAEGVEVASSPWQTMPPRSRHNLLSHREIS
ncbi:efflux RND transporter periplasmic adaptor subunit [Prodigiosinella aquatilis]|nr:efflux RND transporter periplasmic adaptor subunit [Prodigiosinella sp. LS101]WJV55264.1 efflux RND transporter periplasmic adaptor subunit [Prodigiosinella sp. LS101]WJV59625.1 efflux RND transporter periplasmic adaptor subunit [Pectobacteriaceae bacterium C111]